MSRRSPSANPLFSPPSPVDAQVAVVEPTGAAVRVDGTLGLSFSGGHRATQIRCYYDRLAVIEQLVPSAASRLERGDPSVALPRGRRLRFPGTMTGHGPPRR